MQNMSAHQAIGGGKVEFDTRKFGWIGNTTDKPQRDQFLVHDRHQDHPGRDDSANWWSARPAPPPPRSIIRRRSTSSSAPSSRSSPAIRAATTSTWRWSAARSAAAARIPGRRGNRPIRNGWREKKIFILVQIGLKRHPELADVPLMIELAKNEDDRKVLRLPLRRHRDLPRLRHHAGRAARAGRGAAARVRCHHEGPAVSGRSREDRHGHQPHDAARRRRRSPKMIANTPPGGAGARQGHSGKLTFARSSAPSCALETCTCALECS